MIRERGKYKTNSKRQRKEQAENEKHQIENKWQQMINRLKVLTRQRISKNISSNIKDVQASSNLGIKGSHYIVENPFSVFCPQPSCT